MATPAQRLQSERLSYPGLLPREIIIWRAWLRVYEREYDRFDYNLRIGDGVDPGPSYQQEVRRMAIQNSQKRIDAVAWNGDLPTIFEVKDRAGFSALGQLIGYRELWLRDHPGSPAPKLVLVTNRVAGDMLPVLRAAKIELVLIPADFSELRP